MGVVLYRCVTGHRAFDGPPSTLLLRILTQPPKRPTSIVPSLPAAIDSFFDKALAKAPSDRFDDVTSMIDAFACALGEPVAIDDDVKNTDVVAAPVPPLRPSEQTQVAEASYESYAARVMTEDRPSDHRTVEIAAPLLTGHATTPPASTESGRPPSSFGASPWQVGPRAIEDQEAADARRIVSVMLALFLAVMALVLVGAVWFWRARNAP